MQGFKTALSRQQGQRVETLRVDRRPSSGHGRTTPTALIHPANLLQEVAFYGADGGPS